MKNITINNAQKQENKNEIMYIEYILNQLSLGAIAELLKTAVEYTENSIVELSRLHSNLSQLYKSDKYHDALNLLHKLYSSMKSNYADAIPLLHKNKEARIYFINSYIENLGEFIDEINESII